MSIVVNLEGSLSSEKVDDPGHTTAYEANFKLKKAIGENIPLDTIFTPEKIAAGDKAISDSRNQFFIVATAEIEKLLTLVNSESIDINKVLPEVARITASLKGEGEIHGFLLIQKICSHLLDTCQDQDDNSATKLGLIRDLLQAMHFAVKHEVKDDGGDTGRALLADMSHYREQKKTKTRS